MNKFEDPLGESMTVAKTATCDTLTRKSKLTYQIGTLPDGEVYVRVHKNSGNGFFSNEWIALSDIQKVMGKIPAGKPITAIILTRSAVRARPGEPLPTPPGLTKP